MIIVAVPDSMLCSAATYSYANGAELPSKYTRPSTDCSALLCLLCSWPLFATDLQFLVLMLLRTVLLDWVLRVEITGYMTAVFYIASDI
ncbi:hypothetical protein Vi05172_g779 [Venturia inaequalis]|nr:hypothetical protein Vi05172_g779 [Venturia inaequalis]